MDQPTNSNKTESSISSLVNYKDEEKLMSESLHRNLHVLARFHEPTAEFLLIFHPYMFIKSNAKAFFPVIHFIFNCLDAAEFNKRFRWPILDKTSETNFRKATVDYMNHLNGTYQLGLETMKLSNIHIPGGLKFIKIIHKFTYLAMKLELNKPEHGPLPDMKNIPDPDDMLVKLEEYVERGMDLATRLQAQSDKLIERIDEMRAMMESCFVFTDESDKKEMCWACFEQEWKDHLDTIVRDEVGPQLEVVNLFSKHTVQLNQLLTKLFVEKKENIIEYDKNQLTAAQIFLKKMHPDLEPVIDGIVEGNTINFDNLFKVFSFLLPKITNKIETFKCGDLEAIQYELDEIIQFDTTATKYQDNYNEYRDLIQRFIEKDLENFRIFCQNNFNSPFNLMETPPVTRRPQLNRMRNRLTMIDDPIKKAQLFKEPTMLKAPRNVSTLRPSSCSSLSNYKSHDAALQLLGKPKSSRANLSQTSIHNMSAISKFTSTPKLSSTMTSAVVNRKNAQPELKFSPSFGMTPTRVFSENFTETTAMMSPNGISVVRQVATSSVIHLNHPHIRSPTRRIYASDIPREFASFMPANTNLDEMENGNRTEEVKNVADGHQQNTKTGSHKDVNHDIHNGTEIAIAASRSPCIEMDELGVDFIGNVSDTVLNDISVE